MADPLTPADLDALEAVIRSQHAQGMDYALSNVQALALLAEVRRLKEVLRSVEWVRQPFYGDCPCCHNCREVGHSKEGDREPRGLCHLRPLRQAAPYGRHGPLVPPAHALLGPRPRARDGGSVMANARRVRDEAWFAAERIRTGKGPSGRFGVRTTCCGRDDGTYLFASWKEADAFREAYLSGPGVGGPSGHQRSAIIVANRCLPTPGAPP